MQSFISFKNQTVFSYCNWFINFFRCSEYRCQPGKQIGVKEVDHSKEYPDCCGGPICKD